jgi:hypothetical protein
LQQFPILKRDAFGDWKCFFCDKIHTEDESGKNQKAFWGNPRTVLLEKVSSVLVIVEAQ